MLLQGLSRGRLVVQHRVELLLLSHSRLKHLLKGVVSGLQLPRCPLQLGYFFLGNQGDLGLLWLGLGGRSHLGHGHNHNSTTGVRPLRSEIVLGVSEELLRYLWGYRRDGGIP